MFKRSIGSENAYSMQYRYTTFIKQMRAIDLYEKAAFACNILAFNLCRVDLTGPNGSNTNTFGTDSPNAALRKVLRA